MLFSKGRAPAVFCSAVFLGAAVVVTGGARVVDRYVVFGVVWSRLLAVLPWCLGGSAMFLVDPPCFGGSAEAVWLSWEGLLAVVQSCWLDLLCY